MMNMSRLCSTTTTLQSGQRHSRYCVHVGRNFGWRRSLQESGDVLQGENIDLGEKDNTLILWGKIEVFWGAYEEFEVWGGG